LKEVNSIFLLFCAQTTLIMVSGAFNVGACGEDQAKETPSPAHQIPNVIDTIGATTPGELIVAAQLLGVKNG